MDLAMYIQYETTYVAIYTANYRGGSDGQASQAKAGPLFLL